MKDYKHEGFPSVYQRLGGLRLSVDIIPAEFVNLEGHITPDGRTFYQPAETVRYKGNNSDPVIYQQAIEMDGHSKGYFVIVPGIIASEKYRTKSGLSAVKVKPIPEEDRGLVRKILEKRTKGPINFW